MVGDGADAECPLSGIGGVGVETGGLHLNGEDTHPFPLVVFGTAFGGVEGVGRENVADAHVDAAALCGCDGGAEECIVRNGGEGGGFAETEVLHIVGIGAGGLSGHQITQLQVILQCAGGADADDVVDVIEIEELPAVDADGRDTHTGSHDGDRDTLPGAGVALNSADIVDQNGVGEEGFGDELGAQWITGHEHGFGDLVFLRIDVGGGNRHRRYLHRCICEKNDRYYYNRNGSACKARRRC